MAGGNPEALGRNLRRAGRRLGVAAADEVLAIMDGAPWIRNPLQRFGHGDHIGLDDYHFSEHASEAARLCFGHGSEPTGAQAMPHLTALEDSNEWEAYWQLPDVHQD